MADICERCKENSVAHRGVRLHIKRDNITPNREYGFIDICDPCWSDLINKVDQAFDNFRGPE